MPWGVPVPGDDDHVMYVWFDALTSYISTLGWPNDKATFDRYWVNGSPVQYCGKDNLRQQSAMWQAMLMSVELPNSAHIIIDGFIMSGGQKMSKSLGNVINPFDVIEMFKGYAMYPEDVLRFVLLHDIPSFEDGDLTPESIKLSYVTHLQNGLGNLTSRIMKMATTHLTSPVKLPEGMLHTVIEKEISSYDLKRALETIMSAVRELDQYIQETEPFKVIKVDRERGQTLIAEMVERLHALAVLLIPFLPNSAKEIQSLIREHKMPDTPLFNRLP
jgi:methionyl-tRNA synthetase